MRIDGLAEAQLQGSHLSRRRLLESTRLIDFWITDYVRRILQPISDPAMIHTDYLLVSRAHALLCHYLDTHFDWTQVCM